MVEFEEMMKNTREIIRTNNGRNNGRINIAVMFPTPHPERKSFTNVNVNDLKNEAQETYQISTENKLMFTMDGHTKGTIKYCIEELEILGSNSLLSHSTEITEEEIKLCKKYDIGIAHNPSAVASITGRCPVPVERLALIDTCYSPTTGAGYEAVSMALEELEEKLA